MEFFPGAFETEWERRKAAFLHERSLLRGTPSDEIGTLFTHRRAPLVANEQQNGCSIPNN
jgi:hypothetical protein